MSISNILEDNYTLIKQSDKIGIVEVLYCNIQIKVNRPELKNKYQSLYKDIKLFIRSYIETLDDRDFGYDSFDPEKLLNAIDYLNSNSEKLELLNFTLRKLMHFDLEDEIKPFKSKASQTKSLVLLEKKQYVKYVLNLTTYNWIAILFTILLIMVFNTVLFLPAPFESWELFEIKFHNYSNQNLINSFSNVLAFIFSVKGDFKVTPICLSGLLIIVFIKFLYISVILNYLYKKIIELIN